MRDLQEAFDTGPKYGKNIVWDKFMVHDAASVLRRYLNQMPVSAINPKREDVRLTRSLQEPIVPLDLYSEFRNVMHKQPLDVEAAIKTYRLLVKSMPPANQYLLLYVLDLLAVFARKSNVNRMPASSELKECHNDQEVIAHLAPPIFFCILYRSGSHLSTRHLFSSITPSRR